MSAEPAAAAIDDDHDDVPPPLQVDLETILDGLPTPSTDSSTTSPRPFLYMPAEWAPHSACFILFPHNSQTFRLEHAQKEILHLAQQIVQEGQEDVYLLCHNLEMAKIVKKHVQEIMAGTTESKDSISHSIHVHVCPSDDTWARDTAPTFVWRQQDHGAQRQLIGLDWNFNAYGGPIEGCYWPCTKDQQIARTICSSNSSDSTSMVSALQIHASLSVPLVLEGGSIHTDGEGTLLTTEECLLHRSRNPHLSQQDIETILQRSLGIQKVLWLPTGLDADEDTNGHVDNFCCFVQPGHVVLAWTDDIVDDEANYHKCRQAEAYLQNVVDAKGRRIQVTKLYLPSPPLQYSEQEAMSLAILSSCNIINNDDDEEEESRYIMTRHPKEKMAASYVNFYIANRAVLVPQFGGDAHATDAKAVATLQHVFQNTNRTVVGVPSREILLGGGNIHCQTQQVPLVRMD